MWQRAADALASRAMKKLVDTSLSVEKRVEALEREFAMLRDQVLGLKPLTKDCPITVVTDPLGLSLRTLLFESTT